MTVIGNESTKLHIARHLVVRDLAAAEVADLLGAALAAGAQDDAGAQLLAVFGIGHADALHVENLRMPVRNSSTSRG